MREAEDTQINVEQKPSIWDVYRNPITSCFMGMQDITIGVLYSCASVAIVYKASPATHAVYNAISTGNCITYAYASACNSPLFCILCAATPLAVAVTSRESLENCVSGLDHINLACTQYTQIAAEQNSASNSISAQMS